MNEHYPDLPEDEIKAIFDRYNADGDDIIKYWEMWGKYH
jgi:hypothetical protein